MTTVRVDSTTPNYTCYLLLLWDLSKTLQRLSVHDDLRLTRVSSLANDMILEAWIPRDRLGRQTVPAGLVVKNDPYVILLRHMALSEER